jgi:hypothetical protein
MYLRGGKTSITFPSSFIYVATKLPPSLLYLLTYKVVVQKLTNPTLEVQWCIFELSFVSFVCHQEAIPWWHFRSNWKYITTQTPKMTQSGRFWETWDFGLVWPLSFIHTTLIIMCKISQPYPFKVPQIPFKLITCLLSPINFFKRYFWRYWKIVFVAPLKRMGNHIVLTN